MAFHTAGAVEFALLLLTTRLNGETAARENGRYTREIYVQTQTSPLFNENLLLSVPRGRKTQINKLLRPLEEKKTDAPCMAFHTAGAVEFALLPPNYQTEWEDSPTRKWASYQGDLVDGGCHSQDRLACP
ncbi:hypothetical protein CEXT_574451 [Caerostris extrusa]|uniref:Uncharacterized protein n=1 Tax=Caerostris extrusa TaxID=172846 RepID=A0AAV4XY81_CAEEX|nr:hypothetical protein CEXT_574451 [Caerostris extrusa]